MLLTYDSTSIVCILEIDVKYVLLFFPVTKQEEQKKRKERKNLSTTYVCLVNNIPRQQKENLTQLEATYNDKLGKTKKEGRFRMYAYEVYREKSALV